MGHHKRGIPSNSRAGCKLCKPWKINGFPTAKEGGEQFADHKRREFAAQDIEETEMSLPVSEEPSGESLEPFPEDPRDDYCRLGMWLVRESARIVRGELADNEHQSFSQEAARQIIGFAKCVNIREENGRPL